MSSQVAAILGFFGKSLPGRPTNLQVTEFPTANRASGTANAYSHAHTGENKKEGNTLITHKYDHSHNNMYMYNLNLIINQL